MIAQPLDPHHHHLRTTTGVHTVTDWPTRCHFCGSPDVTIVWSTYPGIGWCDNCEPDAGWQLGDPPAYRRRLT